MEPYKRIMWGSIILAGIAALWLIGYFFFIQESPKSLKPSTQAKEKASPPLSTPQVKEAAQKGDQQTPPLEIELKNSDDKVRELLQGCSSHPVFTRWLENQDLIRRFVAVINNIANGDSPAAHLEFMIPLEKFLVIEKKGRLTINPESYRRYDLAGAVFSTLDSKRLVDLYRQLYPVIEEAFKELGFPEKNFDDILIQALKALLKVPIVEGDILLEEKVTSYAFKDPRLEKLNNGQKHLLRMGPGNVKKIHRKLKELVDLLE